MLKSICTEKDRLFRAETEIFLLNVEEFCFRKSGSQEQGILITKKSGIRIQLCGGNCPIHHVSEGQVPQITTVHVDGK